MLKLENSIRGLSFSRVAFDLTIQDIKNQKRSLASKPFMPHFDINYIISKHGRELDNSLPCFHL